jgi:hypothetical protein
MKEIPISFIEKRRIICGQCEHQKIIIGARFCDICGCAIWGKTLLKFEKCPEGKWDVEKD